MKVQNPEAYHFQLSKLNVPIYPKGLQATRFRPQD